MARGAERVDNMHPLSWGGGLRHEYSAEEWRSIFYSAELHFLQPPDSVEIHGQLFDLFLRSLTEPGRKVLRN